MINKKEDYIKIKNLIQESLNSLKVEKNDELEKVVHSTRFELKNKITADEIMNKVELRWREDFFWLRKKWSYYIFASLAGTILFQFFLTGFLIFWVTHNIFLFKEVYNLFFLIAWENFAQILGLSYIIVRYLFSSKN